MQLIPILVVEDHAAALEFYAKAFGAETLLSFDRTTQLRVQDQIFAVREGDKGTGQSSTNSVLLLIQTAAPDSVESAAIEHGAETITPVEDKESGIRAGRFRDPFGFQWIVSTKPLQ